MPRQQTPLVNDEIYHIVLRAIGNETAFNDLNDYYRAIFSIYEFNNSKPTEIWRRRRDRISEKKIEKIVGSPRPNNLPVGGILFQKERFVEILVFAFMPNHIHLLVKQLKEDGISRFMQKVGGGYANYFNKKYNRKGHLFNQYKAILIKTDNQLRNVFVYINANPASLIEPNFKKKGVRNPKQVIEFLENYKWSSYQDYIGKNNFPSVTIRNFMLETLNGATGCRRAVNDWINYKKELNDWADIILE